LAAYRSAIPESYMWRETVYAHNDKNCNVGATFLCLYFLLEKVQLHPHGSGISKMIHPHGIYMRWYNQIANKNGNPFEEK